MGFVKGPGGLFDMGCHVKVGECQTNEKPTRTVRLDGFMMGQHEQQNLGCEIVWRFFFNFSRMNRRSCSLNPPILWEQQEIIGL